ncbi:hypothetical protein, partial [Helicobacter sp. UBA3407]|uniref:hypothetical protein n=1 Tax=Helicobacter sp. UBA3407 TaxID=1946588 RepID=UPI00260A2F6A
IFFNKGFFVRKIVLGVVLVFGLCAYASPKINNEADVFEKKVALKSDDSKDIMAKLIRKCVPDRYGNYHCFIVAV